MQETNTDRNTYVPDPRGSVELGNGYTLRWVIRSNGERWPIIEKDDCHDPVYLGQNVARVYAPHEGTGQIPREMKSRLGMVCGARTSSGKSCRNRVRVYGDRCHAHGGGA